VAKSFLTIDGLRKLVELHPEFEWMRYENEPDKFRVAVSRSGSVHIGECTGEEMLGNGQTSAVWRTHGQHMAKVTAIRRAYEGAFPEFTHDHMTVEVGGRTCLNYDGTLAVFRWMKP
jgi:hypothetical protein